MTPSSISTSAQALASYAVQLQAAQQKNRAQEYETKQPEQAERSQGGDRVTLSAQDGRGNGLQAESRINRNAETLPADSPQVVERKQLDSLEETRSAASKSVTQALEAYVQTSRI